MIVDSQNKMNFVKKNFTPVKNLLLNKNSVAENHFKDLLTKANLYFVREKCNFKYNSRWCYFDFYLPFYRIYIEIDGDSHNNEGQKKIDEQKKDIAKRKQRFLARFTNEEILAMDKIDVETIIDRVALQLKTKRHPKRDYHKQYYQNFKRNYADSIDDMKKTTKFVAFDDAEVFLYDHYIGNYFCFKNIFEAKMNTQLSINEIFELLNDYEYKKSGNRRFVFGWTLQECENNVAKVYY